MSAAVLSVRMSPIADTLIARSNGRHDAEFLRRLVAIWPTNSREPAYKTRSKCSSPKRPRMHFETRHYPASHRIETKRSAAVQGPECSPCNSSGVQ